MNKVFVVLTIFTVIFSLGCTSLIAEESREIQRQNELKRDDDRNEHVEQESHSDERDQPEGLYERLFAELERQREENRALREEIQHLREEIIHLLSNQVERQEDEITTLRTMLEEQYNFVRRLLEEEYELRKAKQLVEVRKFEMEMGEHNPDIERELAEIQEAVERDPNNLELRMKLGDLYWKIDKIEDALHQYKTALSIDPDFDPAFEALEKLRAEFPDISPEREREKPLEDIAGTVVSANKEEIKLRVGEGEILTFRVGFRRREDGSWALNEDLSEFAESLEPGMRVGLQWQEEEGRRVIRRIERIENEE